MKIPDKPFHTVDTVDGKTRSIWSVNVKFEGEFNKDSKKAQEAAEYFIAVLKAEQFNGERSKFNY